MGNFYSEVRAGIHLQTSDSGQQRPRNLNEWRDLDHYYLNLDFK